MQRLIFVLFVLLISIGLFAQNNEQQKEVTEKMNSLKQALLSKDSIGLSALLSDDVTYGHSNGLIQTKAQLIRSVMSGDQDYKTIEPSEINIRMFNDAGVVTSKLKVSLIYSGKPVDLNMFATSTWIKTNGDWKLVARQTVKLPAP